MSGCFRSRPRPRRPKARGVDIEVVLARIHKVGVAADPVDRLREGVGPQAWQTPGPGESLDGGAARIRPRTQRASAPGSAPARCPAAPRQDHDHAADFPSAGARRTTARRRRSPDPVSATYRITRSAAPWATWPLSAEYAPRRRARGRAPTRTSGPHGRSRRISTLARAQTAAVAPLPAFQGRNCTLMERSPWSTSAIPSSKDTRGRVWVTMRSTGT